MEIITIKDIAKALNLSTSTISRALRDSHEINPQTKELVLAYAKKVNYKPNPIALSLQGSKSKAIGVIVPEISNNFFSGTIQGIEEVAYKRGYHLLIFQTNESFEREQISVESIINRRVDGLLITLSGQTTDVSHLEDYINNNGALVMFDRVSDKIDTHKVVVDNFKGAFEATEHLILSGRKKIALIGSLPWLSNTCERVEGYKAALQKHQLAVDESFIRYCSSEPVELNELIQIIEQFLNQENKPDAFFTSSDRITLTCLQVLRQNQVQIPDELALVGYTNLNVAHLLNPAMSTVYQPAFEMGQTATELLLDLIERKKKTTQFQTVCLRSKLIIRESSRVKFNKQSTAYSS